jgi:penicillin amidase
MTSPVLVLLSLTIAASAVSAAQESPVQRRIVVKGLKAKAEILVDQWGVPHIYASTSDDAFFVQGWNAARDRLWQIDMWRRSGLGELAAVLGEKFVAKDRAARLFSYRGDIRKEWAAYGPEARRNTEAFVAGINAYVAAARADPKLMPPEFGLAGYQPAFWKTDDVPRVRNHTIAFSARLQVGRAQMVCKDGSTDQFLPAIVPSWTPIVPEGLDLCSIPPNVLEQYSLARAPVIFTDKGLAAAAESPAEAMLLAETQQSVVRGSNNWVIGPSKSATGRPILANDPHYVESVPSPFYIAHLSAPGLNVIGAGEPAVPGIVFGHNESIAVGMTIFWMAQEDLYVYETNPRNPNQYRYRDRWEPMRVDREAVAVRGGPKRDVELKFTRHGPVVMEDVKHRRAYAVRAAWLDTGGAFFMSSSRYQRAKSIDDVAAALKHWRDPGINHVVADTSGKIGWFPAGLMPVRPNTDGLLPLPGDGRYEWNGYLDRDLLPSEVNPSRGYIATANNMNLPKDYPYAQRPISFFWFDNARIGRITEVLEGLPKVSIKDSERLQNEHVTVPGRRLVRLLGTLTTTDPQLAQLVEWLAAWDANVDATSAQAALYEVWLSRHLIPGVIAKTAPSLPASLGVFASDFHTLHIVDLLEHPNQRLGDRPVQARDELMLSTLAAAFAETKALLGPDRSTWQWGKLATVLFEHQLSPRADPAQRAVMNVGPAPMSGDVNVVGMAEYDSKTFRTIGGASFRMVLDVGEWDNSVAVNNPGQSGNWTSPHYRDLFPLWHSGQYFPLLYSRTAIERAAKQQIVLVPAGDQ